MKRMMMNGLHLGEKLRSILRSPKRTEKEHNAGKTNPVQCPIEEKQDMTDEEVSDRDRIPEDIDIHAEIQYTRSKSHWFGRGEPYYTYQDTYPTPDMTDEEYLQMCDISDRETSRAYELERQPSSMLPILDYCYGKWVSALYALIAVFWCAGAIMGWKAVKGSWNRVLYGSCFLLLAAQVLGPLLEQLGILIWSMPVLFSEMDWDYWVLCVVPFFAAMAALIAGREGNEQPLT